MQIIGGSLRGRKLVPLQGRDIRPTSSMARESIFNILMHRTMENGDSYVIDKNIADLCCGSGAMGLEAISRGAAHATFVDAGNASLDIARENAKKFSVETQADFIRADALRLPPPRREYHVIFCDPPYGAGMNEKILRAVQKADWLAAGGLIVTEQSGKEPTPNMEGYALLLERDYGRAKILVLEKR